MSEILIYDGAIYTGQGWVDPGYLVIEGTRILDIFPGSPKKKLLEACTTVIPASNKAVVPGLTNAHTHLSQTFMRGLAGGRPLLDWLKEIIWPLQNAFSPEDMHLAAKLGLVENLRCGATSVTDHHKITSTPEHTDAVCEAAASIGLRCTLARSWADLGSGAEAPDQILLDLERLQKIWGDHPRVEIANGPLALWRCSADTLQQTHRLVKDWGGRTHFHVSETQEEVRLSLEEYGQRPVEWLDRLKVLDGDTEAVHAVWVNPDEVSLLADARAVVIHCPVSNAVLGSGVAPIPGLLEAGIPIRLGTDGPASNDNQDIWETAKSALTLARVSHLDAALLPPPQVLDMALAGKTLAPGGEADLVIVDLDHPRAAPVQDLPSALILGIQGGDVETVIVQGELLMKEKNVLVIDEPALLEDCRAAVGQLKKRAGINI